MDKSARLQLKDEDGKITISWNFSWSQVPLESSRSTLDVIRKEFRLPGLATGILDPSRTIHFQATGYRKRGNPTLLTSEDKFHLGSCTKAMTATLIAILIEDGLFNWTSKLYDIFPERREEMYPEQWNTTLAMLGAHRSGILDDWVTKKPLLLAKMYEDLEPAAARDLVVREVLSQSPGLTPGDQFSCSNTGYILLGRIIDEAGAPWEEMIQRRLFVPLGMNGCGFGPSPQRTPLGVDNPWPHKPSMFGPIPILPATKFSDNPPVFGPAGTVQCTLESYARFLAIHVDGFNGRNTPVLEADAFKILHRAWPGQDYTSGGWGIGSNRLANGTVFVHSGSNAMNYITTWLMPKLDKAFWTATNIEGEDAGAGLNQVVAHYLDGTL